MKVSTKAIAIVVVTLSALVVGSCSKKKTYKTPSGDVTVTGNNEQATWKAEDGTTATVGQGVAIPDDFPKDVPMVEGANVMMATKSPKGHSVRMQTSKKAAELVPWFKKELEGDGWTEQTATTLPNGGMFTYIKGERKTHFTIAESGPMTTVSINAQ